MTDGPVITHVGIFDLQVCVPQDWTDDEAEGFANRENECGTTKGWTMRRNGSSALQGASERVTCEGRAGFVHIMMDA